MNMGGIKYGLGFANPHPDVLKRYRELGGEIVTVGSDAHRPEDVGLGMAQSLDLLRELGFRAVNVYRRREPRSIPL